MSASLVGSEMCIRDSRAAVRHARTRARSWPSRGLSVEATWRSLRGRAAVSYTHLTLPTICSV
eukprot:7257762-Alexandrium_andersonii.AAC.1